MSRMTREDRLRELELIPIWQLRLTSSEIPANARQETAQQVTAHQVTVHSNVTLPQTAMDADAETDRLSKEPSSKEASSKEALIPDAQEDAQAEANFSTFAPIEPLQADIASAEEYAETASPASSYAASSVSHEESPVSESTLLPEVPAEDAVSLHTFEAADNVSTSPETTSVRPPLAPVRMLLSDDAAFMFLLAPVILHADAALVETLYKNMIRAMRIHCRTDMVDSIDTVIAAHRPRVIISMGAAPINQVTGKTHTIEQWRTQQQDAHLHYDTLPLIVTYSPEHLLDNVADKALAWRDLCAAIKLAQHL